MSTNAYIWRDLTYICLSKHWYYFYFIKLIKSSNYFTLEVPNKDIYLRTWWCKFFQRFLKDKKKINKLKYAKLWSRVICIYIFLYFKVSTYLKNVKKKNTSFLLRLYYLRQNIMSCTYEYIRVYITFSDMNAVKNLFFFDVSLCCT